MLHVLYHLIANTNSLFPFSSFSVLIVYPLYIPLLLKGIAKLPSLSTAINPHC